MVRAIQLWIEDNIYPFMEMTPISWLVVIGFFIIEITFIAFIILAWLNK
jgi:hypothetical protein